MHRISRFGIKGFRRLCDVTIPMQASVDPKARFGSSGSARMTAKKADEQDLRKLKDLRNAIAHEYVTENIVRFFGTVLDSRTLFRR